MSCKELFPGSAQSKSGDKSHESLVMQSIHSLEVNVLDE